MKETDRVRFPYLSYCSVLSFTCVTSHPLLSYMHCMPHRIASIIKGLLSYVLLDALSSRNSRNYSYERSLSFLVT